LQATILVVEDNFVNQLMITQSLRKFGFNLVIAANGGKEALEMLATLEPDLIITDLMMPEIDGFMLCQEIRRMPHLQNIPILALTALENEKIRLSIFDMGASDLVRKPITEEELVARCRIHLEKRYILKDLQEYQLRMKEDLRNARAMQNLLMPDHAAIADAEFKYGMGISSLFAPSFTIGGDFWGIHAIHPHKLAFYIGDFTGHGVTSAINVFRLCTLMDKLPMHTLSCPKTCLTQLNEPLFANLPIQLFATMFYGIIDTQKDTITYSIAGCPPPLKLCADGTHAILGGAGLPLAAIENPEYHVYTCDFFAGDALLLYSDALIESPDNDNNYLQITDIAKQLIEEPRSMQSADAILRKVLRIFSQFTSVTVKDDLTLNVYMRNR
jgi:sigma-B regulation protein RsbU (phosphoserine phosphatase)